MRSLLSSNVAVALVPFMFGSTLMQRMRVQRRSRSRAHIATAGQMKPLKAPYWILTWLDREVNAWPSTVGCTATHNQMHTSSMRAKMKCTARNTSYNLLRTKYNDEPIKMDMDMTD